MLAEIGARRMIAAVDSEISAFVLAGGKSTRMGTDKAFVMLNGRTLLSTALEVARALTPHVQIVGDPANYQAFAPVIEDSFPGCGPLAGIHAALRASQTEWNLILAVDTPFLSAALLHYVVSRAKNSDATVTLPRAAGGLQPLCAVYRREFSNLAEQALNAGQYKIDRLFDQTTVLVIPEEELERAGFGAQCFRNFNTLQDLASVRERTER